MGYQVPYVPLPLGGNTSSSTINIKEVATGYTGNNFKNSLPIQKISPIHEMKKMREKSLCYFYDEKGILAIIVKKLGSL